MQRLKGYRITFVDTERCHVILLRENLGSEIRSYRGLIMAMDVWKRKMIGPGFQIALEMSSSPAGHPQGIDRIIVLIHTSIYIYIYHAFCSPALVFPYLYQTHPRTSERVGWPRPEGPEANNPLHFCMLIGSGKTHGAVYQMECLGATIADFYFHISLAISTSCGFFFL